MCGINIRAASATFAFFDIVIGAITLYVSSQAIYNLKDGITFLKQQNISDDVAWYGIFSIPLFAGEEIWSGFKLIWSLCTKNTEDSNQIAKFVIFIIVEVIGYVAPFWIFQDYELKIKALTDFSEHFLIYHLLLVQPVPVALFIYQIISFIVVFRFKLLLKERARKRPTKVILRSEKTDSQAATTQTLISPKKLDTHGKLVYPNLDELMVDLLPSPTYKKPDHTVLNVELTNCLSDSEWTDVSDDESNSIRTKHKLSLLSTQFKLKKQILLKNRTLFEDTEFPANKASLGSGRHFEWKRPHEIAVAARFFTDGFSRFDVRQGELGDCWFLAALANLTLNDDLFTKVVPLDNEWADDGKGKGYCGMCHFRFWVDGSWKEVIIDDRLPTRNGKLVFLHSSDKTEFWSALLEKAYAKLNGSYMNLSGNDGIGRAMTNLTSGKVTRHLLEDYQQNLMKLFELMDHALNNGKMLGCCCRKGYSSNGIYTGHAYSITHVKRIQLNTRKEIPCIRIRNPWGNEKEWNGNFSDGHAIWNLVEKKVRKELKIIFESDGEFWFPVKELVDYFHMIEICHLP